MVYRATGKTPLIKNEALVHELQEAQAASLVRFFDRYERDNGLARLAEVFYRFKPLFLAMRTNTKMRQTVNQFVGSRRRTIVP